MPKSKNASRTAPAALPSAVEVRERFYALAGDPRQFCLPYEAISGVSFFMKDLEGRFIAISEGQLSCMDHSSLDQTRAYTDADLYPEKMAKRVRADDHRVMASGQPLMNIVELLVNPARRTIGWYVTHKYPVRGRDGSIIGIMGTVQPYDVRRAVLLADSKLDSAIEYIRSQACHQCSVEEAARIACLSPRQFRRSFLRVLGLSPAAFIISNRLQHACELLVHTRDSVGQIADQCGFYDHGALGRHFHRQFGLSPLAYRKKYHRLTQAKLPPPR